MTNKFFTKYWILVLDDLKNEVSETEFAMWFNGLELEEVENQIEIVIRTKSRYSKDVLESKFKNLMLSTILGYFPNITQITYQFDELAELQKQLPNTSHKYPDEQSMIKAGDIFGSFEQFSNQAKDESAARLNFNKREILEPEAKKSTFSSLPSKSIHNLNSKFGFDSLVITSYIELATSVAKAIIRQPGTLYNPVFIHSGTGLGKTHLLQAIGNKLLEERPNFQIRYITAEIFMNHYTTSMQKGRIIDFKNYYRDIDILLIDYIQFLASKAGTQDIFFHTFDSLHQNDKQIIISSDKSPKLLGGFEERLLSRFEWGMVLELPQPELEDRIAIINDKAARLLIPLDANQILLIASQIQTNIRDIEGALNKIKAAISLHPGEFLDDSRLAQILSPWEGVMNEGIMQFSYRQPSRYNQLPAIKQHNPVQSNTHRYPAVSPNKSLNESVLNSQIQQICSLNNVTIIDIFGNSRDKLILEVRQLVVYFLYTECGFSFHQIGKMLGNKSHTTMMYNFKKAIIQLKCNRKARQMMDEIIALRNLADGVDNFEPAVESANHNKIESLSSVPDLQIPK